MEYRDIYTSGLQKTGKTVPHGYKLGKAEYYYHVHLLLRDSATGMWLMQQRSLDNDYFPGAWDVTGGGVSAGEDGRTAAVREAAEELNVHAEPESLIYIGRETQLWGEDRGNITDVFAARLPIDIDSVRIQASEVNDVKLVAFDEFAATVTYNKTDYYRKMLADAQSALDAQK